MARSPRTGGVWAGFATRYALEHWGPNGDLWRVIETDFRWFGPYVDGRPSSPEHPPKPWLRAIGELEDGSLAVLVNVAGREWERAFGRRRMTDHGPQYFVDEDLLWDSVIHVIDPGSGSLLAEARVDHRLWGFVDPSTVFSSHEDDEGYPRIDVWRLAYGPPSRGR